LWIGEADRYRETICCVSTPRAGTARFGGGVSDESSFAAMSARPRLSAVVHGFFVDGMLRGAAELRPLGPTFVREAEAALKHEGDWQSHGVGSILLRPHAAHARKSRDQDAAYACPRQQPAGCRSWRGNSPAELSFDFGGVW